MKDKISLLFLPFVIALIGLTIGYTFLHWLIFIEIEIFPLKEIITDFGIPTVLSGVTVWFLLRPKFKILILEVKNGNLRDFYSFMLWIILTVPLVIAQVYMVSATGKLNELTSANEINNSELTKYYTIKDYFIDKKKIGVHSAFDVSGKHNDQFNMHIYIALPIFKSALEARSAGIEPKAWLGIEYKKSISNRLEPNEKEIEYQQFANKSQADFDTKNVSQFIYLERIGYSDQRDGFVEAMDKNPNYEPNEIILKAINRPFPERNGSKFSWLIGSALVGSIIWLLMVFIPKIDNKQLKRIKAGKPDKEEEKEIQDFISFLIPKEGFFITPIIVYLNILVFIIMMTAGLGFISIKGQDLLIWGANYRPSTTDGQWWRLFSSIFLHGGFMHLLFNMYGLLFVGIILEPVLGRVKYLSAYLLTGVLASCASLWWYDATISVGASGAIFGMYGLFLALILTKIFSPDFSKAFLLSTLVFVGFNLLMGITGGIDNAAHIGGLISGFIIGLILTPTLNKVGKEE